MYAVSLQPKMVANLQVMTSYSTTLPPGAANLGHGANALPSPSEPQQGSATLPGPLNLASSALDKAASAVLGAPACKVWQDYSLSTRAFLCVSPYRLAAIASHKAPQHIAVACNVLPATSSQKRQDISCVSSRTASAFSGLAGPDCKLPKCGAVLSMLWNNTVAQLSAASVADAAAADSGSSSTLNALITYIGKAVVRLFLAPVQSVLHALSLRRAGTALGALLSQ